MEKHDAALLIVPRARYLLIDGFSGESPSERAQRHEASHSIACLEAIFTLDLVESMISRCLPERTRARISLDISSGWKRRDLIGERKCVCVPYVRLATRLKRMFVYSFQYHCSHELNTFALRKYVRTSPSSRETTLTI